MQKNSLKYQILVFKMNYAKKKIFKITNLATKVNNDNVFFLIYLLFDILNLPVLSRQSSLIFSPASIISASFYPMYMTILASLQINVNTHFSV